MGSKTRSNYALSQGISQERFDLIFREVEHDTHQDPTDIVRPINEYQYIPRNITHHHGTIQHGTDQDQTDEPC